jgi:hypothetical protein
MLNRLKPRYYGNSVGLFVFGGKGLKEDVEETDEKQKREGKEGLQ